MNSTLSQPNLPTPLLVSEKPRTQAKGATSPIRNPQGEPFYARLGQCIDEVRNVFGLSIKEFAAELGKNESQLRRQIEGKERPQLEVVLAVERFRAQLVVALAKLASDVEVETVVRVRRSA